MCIDERRICNPQRIRIRAILAVAVCSGIAAMVDSEFVAAEPIVRNCTTSERLGGRTEPPPALSPAEVRGVVTSPRLATFNTEADPTSFVFTFSGRVNAELDRWHIEVDVLRAADADPKDEGTSQAPNWQHVATIPITGGGPNVFTFSTRIAPFVGLHDAWRPGGLGRLRVVSVITTDRSQCALLPVIDRVSGIDPADPTTLVVADRSVDPTKPLGETNRSIRNPTNTNTPDYLNSNIEVKSFVGNPQLAILATRKYYDTVQTDPDGLGPDKSIRQILPTLKSFIKRYFTRPFEECARDPSDESMRDERPQVATYFNNGDLGIGREMHCVKRGCNGELACYVKNFAELDLRDRKPKFGSLKEARRALRNNRPFATVAMVERQRMPLDAANRVFFVVYKANGKLETAAQLDNKGFNTTIPGNCLQCHGINSRYDAESSARLEVTNAMFLPFDLEVFKFFSNDPNSKLSRASQESKFRALNRMVLQSALGRSSAVQELIEGWYDGDLSEQANHTFREFVPGGWWDRASPDILQQLHKIQLYTNFVAVGCRGCHISWVDQHTLQPGPLTFSTFEDFKSYAPTTIKSIVCGPDTAPASVAHKMPSAEQTLKVLWRSEGRQHFFAQLSTQLSALSGDCRP